MSSRYCSGMPSSARTTADGLVDHVCHVYDGPARMRAFAVPHLATGVRLGQRVVVLAPEHQLDLARAVADEALAEAGVPGAADVAPLGAVYGDGPVDVPATLERVRAVLAAALADGHAGVRALCLLTDAVRDPLRRRAFAAWEHAVGAWQSSQPVASACAYDRSVLGEAAVAELACLHPRTSGHGATPPFRLYTRDGRLVLDGEIDSFSASLLQRAVASLRPRAGERLVVDARGLTFVNHRGLEVLVEGVARRAGGLTLLGTRALPAPLREHLGIPEDLLDVLPWVG